MNEQQEREIANMLNAMTYWRSQLEPTMSTNNEQSTEEQVKKMLDALKTASKPPFSERVQEITHLVELVTLLALHGDKITQAFAIMDLQRTGEHRLWVPDLLSATMSRLRILMDVK